MEASDSNADDRTWQLDERVELLIDAVSDALLSSTLDGRVVACNASACKMFGYTREELLSLSRSDLVLDDERLREVLRERRRSGASHGIVTYVRKNGERFEGEANSVEVPGNDGRARVWTIVRDLGDRRRAELATLALRESNEMLRALTDAAFEAVIMHRDGVILMANRAAEQTVGVPAGGLVGQPLLDFIAPQSLPDVLERIRQQSEEPYEAFGRRADGSVYPCEVQVRVGPINLNGTPARLAAIRDVTERKKLEEEVRHAQKMEAIGRLAGGVAHDFNNLLSVIVGAVGLATQEIESTHPAQEALEDIRRAADRAAELTRKLLAFGRKQVLKLRAVEMNRAVLDMESMIRTFVGAQVKVELVLESKLGAVQADPSQFELMVLNLVANARDAMPNGGVLVIQTRSGSVDAAEATRLGTLPGPHAELCVADDGLGMDEATKERVFEPFFTTKQPGRGTGLGLATVFGIVKQSQGTVSVESQLGRGTKFIVSLPRSTQWMPSDTEAPPSSARSDTRRTIFVVEDEPDVRRVIVQVLLRRGYHVLDVDGPEGALSAVRDRKIEFDLMLTDVLMPAMSGRQLVDEVRALVPDVAVLYMSGYADEAFDYEHPPAAGDDFLPKPFTPDTLVAAVERVLARRAV